ncbi:MAG TPA: hypothetical protein VMV81_12275, partial [Phycisphaerae bacterium]|nr:hypothetical protein [Phycisphaerae bacterium]
MGVVRFDLASNTSLRFATTIDPIDLNVGLDGLLYVQYPGGSPAGFELEVYDPVTLEHVRQIFFGLNDFRACAVNRDGEIYLADSVGNIKRFAPSGTLISQINVCGILAGNCFLSDIDIAPDGALVASSAYGRLVLTDVGLSNPMAFPVPAFNTTTTFVTFVPEPASSMLAIVAFSAITRSRPRRVSRAS